ncbi:FKBP9_10 [Acanthosepion pharaonis]|uniref:FKBP9_10 n=1 Tax=Acanthosepion pharaonis TaxID=158019 RepID=A0A812D3G9_ACAPH|nr:FKBP9_10 [Sepia pharaonis]
MFGHTPSFFFFIPSSYIPPDCSLKKQGYYHIWPQQTSFFFFIPLLLHSDCSLKNCLSRLSYHVTWPYQLHFLFFFIPLLLHSTRLFFEELSLQGYPIMLHGHTNFTSFSSLFPLLLHSTRLFFEELSLQGYPIMLHGHTNFTSFSSLFPSSYIPPDCSLKNCLCKAILSYYMAIPTSLPFLLYSPPPTFHQIVL